MTRESELMRVPLPDSFLQKGGKFGEMLPPPRQMNSPILSISIYAEPAYAVIKGMGSGAGLSALTSPRPGHRWPSSGKSFCSVC